jgi:microcystin-dependent protein
MALPAATDFTGSSITEAQFKTAMTDLVEYLEGLETVTPGAVVYFPRTTAPTGWLKANGAVVTVASYAALVAAAYCGDAANATALSCYRCTSDSNPAGTRSTTGAYFVLPDLRAETIKGLDDGRGIDSARVLASAQADQNKAHAHAGSSGSTASAGVHTHTVRGDTNASASTKHLAVNSNGNSTANTNLSDAALSAGAHTHTVTLTVASDGGTEVRVRNIALLACIKF